TRRSSDLFLMANYVIKNKRGDAVVREDEIYDWFVDKNNATLCDYTNKPFEFVRKVARNVDHYLAFSNGMGNDGRPSLAMASLKRMTGGAFSLHYVLLLRQYHFPAHCSNILWSRSKVSSSITYTPKHQPKNLKGAFRCGRMSFER